MPQFTQGKWEADNMGAYVFAENGKMIVAQMRGFGYLTGTGEGALHLTEEEAIAVQIANARLIAQAPDMYGLLCVLHHEDAIPENLPCGYQALKRFRSIVEAVTGNKVRWDTIPHQKNSSKYFTNTDCEYYPCHENANKDNFNCLFCYCPLYHMANCPGNPEYLPNGVKDCSSCILPHADYDAIIKVLKKLSE